MAVPSIAFLDTVGLLALVNRDDELHAQAVRVYREMTSDRAGLVTSDWVLTEFLNSASKQPLRGAALQAVGRLKQSPRTEIIPATRHSWEQAFVLYSSRLDKTWSLTDCSSIVICQSRHIASVFTRDHHFAQAGLALLLG